VRRPNDVGLFGLGTLFREKDYDLSFIYGGYGYFDNMNAFFSANGYRIVDKTVFAAHNKTFSTAWGQCDEDLLNQSLLEADAVHARGKLFQQVLLTTSNHRPFTYPEGKVDIAPGSSRTGAVMYSDYAIGRFMEAARTRPWFDNTIFIFVGDHPSAVAGRTEVPADAYGIVCIMYGPKFFQPHTVDTLCRQIDVAPTLFSRLTWSYRSQFFGENAVTIPPERGRAWIATYLLLGFRTLDGLAVLDPRGKADVAAITPAGERTVRESAQDAAWRQRLVDLTVGSYQCAYDLFTSGKLAESYVRQR
jgi:phosphoglycerol transferase MdoB-like AlkP superfamily enzyme